MAPPTIDETLALTEKDIDLIVSKDIRQDIFAHLQNAGIQFNNRDPTVRLAEELRRYVCGDDDDSSAVNMATIMAKFNEMSAGMEEVMNEMKEELATSSERLEQRIMKVEKGKQSAQAAALVNVRTARSPTVADRGLDQPQDPQHDRPEDIRKRMRKRRLQSHGTTK